jgi:hypothetical protein
MQQNQITSIIDNCDIHVAFSRVIKYYDPNKAKNRKTKVLDLSTFFSWTETDYKIFDITKTRNLNGSILDNHYDIIIYEPPANQSFFANTVESSKIFNKVLNIGGNILVKVKDFKTTTNGNAELKGSFDLKIIFESNDFYLFDQIIYKTRPSYNQHKSNNDNEITHLYFMIFKKKNPT